MQVSTTFHEDVFANIFDRFGTPLPTLTFGVDMDLKPLARICK